MIKVSIVIPVYNCESFLEQCLKSVLRQTLQEIEVVCVDDGSKDQSADIIRKFASEDRRVHLLEQNNQGAGKARNHGIQKARGKYLVFLDADDYYIDADALEKMVDLCEKKKVSVCGSLRKRLENEKEKAEKLFQDRREELLEQNIYNYLDFQFDYDYQSFLFEKQLLLENGIMFPDYRRFQDPPFLVQVMWWAEKFVIADTYLYCYRVPNMPAKFTEDKVADLLKGLIDNLIFAKMQGLETLFSVSQERLEYEYAGIIYHNISGESKQILELLLQANKIISEKIQDVDYTIHPLRKIMERIRYDNTIYEKELLEWIGKQEKIALYGAGKYAKVFLRYLRRQGLGEKVKRIVVSSLVDNGELLEGVPVISIHEFSNDEEGLLITLGAHFHKEIEDMLTLKRIKNYQFVDDVFLSRI